MRITTDGTVGIGATSGEANLVVRDKTNGTHKEEELDLVSTKQVHFKSMML